MMKTLLKGVKKIFKFLFFFLKWILLQPFCWIFYDRKYLKTRWFKNGIYSLGWEWCWTDILHRIFMGRNLFVRFPISPYIDCSRDIDFYPDDLNNFQGTGNYFQAFDGGRITIGKGCYIAKNVGIITVNHDINNPELHQNPKNVILGDNCWIGMNAMILPGVELGAHTVVGAGAVVTKSYPEGYCILVGNPAKKIKDINPKEKTDLE